MLKALSQTPVYWDSRPTKAVERGIKPTMSDV
jgi:hypothetical protein